MYLNVMMGKLWRSRQGRLGNFELTNVNLFGVIGDARAFRPGLGGRQLIGSKDGIGGGD